MPTVDLVVGPNLDEALTGDLKAQEIRRLSKRGKPASLRLNFEALSRFVAMLTFAVIVVEILREIFRKVKSEPPSIVPRFS